MPAIRVFSLLAYLFVARAISGTDDDDCRWRDAVEFWSSAICAMENFKTVHFHIHAPPIGDKRSSIDVRHSNGRCFEVFVRDVARKCEATVVSRTYAPHRRTPTGNASFVDEFDNNGALLRDRRARLSIWKITSGDVSRDATSRRIKTERTRRDKACYPKNENTWNVHVILARSVQFLGRISSTDSSFEWNPRDRFIALISHDSQEQSNNDSTIDDILRALWRTRKIQSIFVSDVTLNETIVRTYNPFGRINDSAWGEIEIIRPKTAREASSALSRLTYRRTRNMNQYKLRVSTFTKEHTINISNGSRYDYTPYCVYKEFDDLILETLAVDMNFRPRVIHPTDNQKFGYQLPNGTYVGTLGDVTYDRTDVVAEAFFIKKYSATDVEDIDFSTYVDFDRVCVLAPKALKIPKKLRIFHFFPLSIWVLSMAMYVLAVVTWYFLQFFTPGRTENVSFRKTFYRSIMLNVGCPQKMPKSNAERILLSGVLLANVTMVGIFGGILYNSFAHDMYYPDIDNLQDLDASGLPLLLTSYSLRDLFGPENNTDLPQTMRNLRQKMVYSPDSLQKAAYYRNATGFAKESDFPGFNEEFVDANGARLLHLVQECPGVYYLAYLLPRDSILRERMNTVIGRLNQAGLPTLWKESFISLYVGQTRASVRKNRSEIQQEDFVPFDLSDMQSSFYMLLIGLSISTVVFFHERGVLHCHLWNPCTQAAQDILRIIHNMSKEVRRFAGHLKDIITNIFKAM